MLARSALRLERGSVLPVSENPFLKMKTRGVLLWATVGFLALGAAIILIDQSELANPLLLTRLVEFCFYLWILYWIYRKSKVSGVSPRRLLRGGTRIGAPLLIGLILAMFFFSRGSTGVLHYAAFRLWPNLDFLFHSERTLAPSDSSIASLGVMLLGILNIVLVAPLIEEILCRGILLNRWAAKWGVTEGVLLSALVFAIPHITRAPVTFLSGICFAIMYIKTRTLWTPIVAHSLYNGVVTALSFLRESSVVGPWLNTIGLYRSGLWVGILYIGLALPPLLIYIWWNWPRRGIACPYIRKARAPLFREQLRLTRPGLNRRAVERPIL